MVEVGLMTQARIVSVWLDNFKSFEAQELPLDSMTLLIGRNGSGKSNALDALEVLARLATGGDVREVLESRTVAPGIRGGAVGCAPHGEDRFALGCTVLRGDDQFEFRVVVQVSPDVRVVEEELWGPAPAVKSGKVTQGFLFKTVPAPDLTTAVRAELHNGRRGTNPTEDFRDNRLLLSQVPMRISPTNSAGRAIEDACDVVTNTLLGVFHLDPVPHLMRDYVRKQDDSLQRTSANISAAIGRLHDEDQDTLRRIVDLLSNVSDLPVDGVDLVGTSLGDVQMVLRERVGQRVEETPAREMSDGLLRYTAICTALLTSTTGLDVMTRREPSDDPPSVALVIEEIENGLHPAQAQRVLELIDETTSEQNSQVLVTTHSPALLDAVTGDLNRSVVVCYRDAETGKSKLSRITELPGYARAMTLGRLGEVVTQGRLAGPERKEIDPDAFIASLGAPA